MKSKMKLLLSIIAVTGTMALIATGCGGSNNNNNSGKGGSGPHVVIIIHGGYYGYYNNTMFCDWTNNYCSSGNAYGITGNGCYYNDSYACTGGTGGSPSAGSSTGGISPGSTGTSSGGTSSGGYPTQTGGDSTGSTGTSGTSGGAGGAAVPSGGYAAGGGGTSSGGYAPSGGLSNGTTGTVVVSGGTTVTSTTSGGSNGTITTIVTTTGGNSIASGTKDVDLERARYGSQLFNDRVHLLANQFHMNTQDGVEKVSQLLQLSDKMDQMTKLNKFDGEDQLAMTKTALAIAGIEQNRFQAASVDFVQNHNVKAFDPIIEDAANNMSMPKDILRDQLMARFNFNPNNLNAK
jgi:hypothetical protein